MSLNSIIIPLCSLCVLPSSANNNVGLCHDSAYYFMHVKPSKDIESKPASLKRRSFVRQLTQLRFRAIWTVVAFLAAAAAAVSCRKLKEVESERIIANITFTLVLKSFLRETFLLGVGFHFCKKQSWKVNATQKKFEKKSRSTFFQSTLLIRT